MLSTANRAVKDAKTQISEHPGKLSQRGHANKTNDSFLHPVRRWSMQKSSSTTSAYMWTVLHELVGNSLSMLSAKMVASRH